jgi:hypothetical protein
MGGIEHTKTQVSLSILGFGHYSKGAFMMLGFAVAKNTGCTTQRRNMFVVI